MSRREEESWFAWLYDPLMTPLEQFGLRQLRREVVATAQGMVLEVGAGTGLNLPHYCQARLIVATDPNPAMLTRALPRAEKAPCPVLLAAADAQALPFRDHSFDTAVATLAFCTIPNPADAFRELRRVLKPNGELRLLEHVRAPFRPVARLQDWLTPVWQHIAGGCHLNRDSLATALQSGFAISAVRKSVYGIVLHAVLHPT